MLAEVRPHVDALQVLVVCASAIEIGGEGCIIEGHAAVEVDDLQYVQLRCREDAQEVRVATLLGSALRVRLRGCWAALLAGG